MINEWFWLQCWWMMMIMQWMIKDGGDDYMMYNDYVDKAMKDDAWCIIHDGDEDDDAW